MLRRKDWTLRPSPRPGVRHGGDGMSGAITGLYQQQVAAAAEAKARAEQLLQDERGRNDDRIREPCEARDVLERSLREQVDAAKARSHDAEVKCAAMASRLESRDERVARLKDQIAEVKSEVARPRRWRPS